MMGGRRGVRGGEGVRLIPPTPPAARGGRRKGAVAAGMDADLVLFDEAIHVSLTMAEGRIVYQEEEGKESRA